MAIKKLRSSTTQPPTRKTASSGSKVSPDDVSVQAYYLYLKRMKNNAPGNDLSDWLEAEKMMKSSRREERL